MVFFNTSLKVKVNIGSMRTEADLILTKRDDCNKGKIKDSRRWDLRNGLRNKRRKSGKAMRYICRK